MGKNKAKDETLGVFGLVALIIGSTIGTGVFTTAENMAADGAHTGAVLIGWAVAGIGMFMLMMVFFDLNKVKPQLTNGIYSYASECFGHFVGLNSAWGYWLSAVICNVAFITLLFSTLGYFIPVFSESSMAGLIGGSVMIWAITGLVLKGVKDAAFVNIITTISKLIPLFMFIVIIPMMGKFDMGLFMDNFWGDEGESVLDQVMSTTSYTVWSFIGVEGAVVLSARARKPGDVGRASMIGFIGLLSIYLLVAVLSMGIVPYETMKDLPNPGMAYLLEAAVGPWGAKLVNIGVILSVTGAYLGWTIIAAECPYTAAQQGVFTKAFAKCNRNGAPTVSLIASGAIVQALLIMTLVAEKAYELFVAMGSSMIMVPYLLSAVYYMKLSMGKERSLVASRTNITGARIFAFLGTVYGIWMLYAGGLDFFLLTAILYVPAIPVFYIGQKEKGYERAFRHHEKAIAVCIIALALLAVYLMSTGAINPF